MGKKILYIVLGVLLVCGLLFLLWMWFSGGSSNNSSNNGLGSAGNTGQGLGTGQNTGNGQTQLGGPSGTAVGAGSYNAQGVYVGQGNGTYDANGTYVGTVNGTGTAGAGSYNAQGVFVGAGNGTYDANGTYVGTVSRLGTGTGSTGSIGTGGTGTSTTGGLGGGGTGSSTTGTLGGGASGTSTLGFGTSTGTFATTSSGITWFGSPFNPTNINDISSGVTGFAPTITSQINPSNSGTTLIEALAATAIAGSITCAIQAGIVAISTGGGVTFNAPAATAVTAAITGIPPYNFYGLYLGTGPLIVADYGVRTITGAIYGQGVINAARNSAKDNQGFLNCIVNVIAKTALQQLTISTVNWINGGFKGQPAFVSNFEQFFTNTADLAAGQFIQGSQLAFLCSPFKLQIKIAIAQSYANRNAQSCSLTKIIGNVNSFMNGNFAQGGWGGFVSFTTVPTNNPYGAYSYANAGLITAQVNALANAKNNISPTGFLNLQKQVCPATAVNPGTTFNASAGAGQNVGTLNSSGGAINSTNGTLLGSNSQAGQTYCQLGCTCSVTTPGGVIAESLGAVNKSGVDQLGLTQDIDQIISALTTQLMTKILQNGLTSLSQTTTQTAADLAAQSQALTLLNQMQAEVTLTQQLGSIYQGSIADIESAQANLNGLANCWGSVASSTNDTTASQNAVAANTMLQSLSTQITDYNNKITQVNNAIASLNQYISQLSLASSAGEVTSVAGNYNAAVSAGAFPSAADVTTAQQNRTTLQDQFAMTNQSTTTSLQQCRAAGGQ